MANDTIFITVIGIDIEAYSKKDVAGQMMAQKNLENFLIEACEEAGLAKSAEEVSWIDTGDGGFLITTEPYQRVVPFLTSIYSLIRSYNEQAKETHLLHVRAAIHCADVVRWQGKLGVKYAGNAVNVCARILDGMNRSHSGQVVCSGDFMGKLSLIEVLVDAVRLSDQEDKHRNKHAVWNISHSPSFGVSPSNDELFPDPNEWHKS